MQSAPYFDLDLNVVVVAPNGEWVSFSGVWYEPTSKYCYGKPVVTVPDHRLKGLGKAAVTESVRCAKLLGVKITLVGATPPIYQPIGFEQVYSLENGYVRTIQANYRFSGLMYVLNGIYRARIPACLKTKPPSNRHLQLSQPNPTR